MVGVVLAAVAILLILHSQGLLAIAQTGQVYAPVWGSVTCKQGATSVAPMAEYTTPNSQQLTFHCPTEFVSCSIDMKQSRFYLDDQCSTNLLKVESGSMSGWYDRSNGPHLASNTAWGFPDRIVLSGGESMTFTAAPEFLACQGWDKAQIWYEKTNKITHYDDAINAAWDTIGCTKSEILQKLAAEGQKIYGAFHGVDEKGTPIAGARQIASDVDLSGLQLDQSVTFVSQFVPISGSQISTYNGKQVYCRTGPSGSYVYPIKTAGAYKYADPTNPQHVECCADDSYSCPSDESCGADFKCEKNPTCDWNHPCQGESCRVIDGQPTYFNEQCIGGTCKMESNTAVDCCTKSDCPSEQGCDIATHTCKAESQLSTKPKVEKKNAGCNGVCDKIDMQKQCSGGLMVNGMCMGGKLVSAPGACPNDCLSCLPWEQKTGSIGHKTCHTSNAMMLGIAATALVGLYLYINTRRGRGSSSDPLASIGLGGL